MNKSTLILCGLLAATSASAGNHATKAEPISHCHDPAAKAEWLHLLEKAPQDQVVIRLYALREGLCQMVDQGQIPLERAIDLFEVERARAVTRRLMDEAAGRKKYGT